MKQSIKAHFEAVKYPKLRKKLLEDLIVPDAMVDDIWEALVGSFIWVDDIWKKCHEQRSWQPYLDRYPEDKPAPIKAHFEAVPYPKLRAKLLEQMDPDYKDLEVKDVWEALRHAFVDLPDIWRECYYLKSWEFYLKKYPEDEPVIGTGHCGGYPMPYTCEPPTPSSACQQWGFSEPPTPINMTDPPLKNFFIDEQFYSDIGDMLEEPEDLPDDWEQGIEYAEIEKVATLSKEDVIDAVMDSIFNQHEDRLPEESDYIESQIKKAISKSIDIEKLNSLMPSMYYPNGKFGKIKKKDLV